MILIRVRTTSMCTIHLSVSPPLPPNPPLPLPPPPIPLPLIPLGPASSQTCLYGNFSKPKLQEIVVAKGHILELLRPDDTGRVQPVCTIEVFGVIRAVSKLRIPGEQTDHLVVGSDSGRVVILKYDPARARFKKIHQETFGKSGCRRVVPGQYVAVDPRGRALMVGALEKSKLVYILNRDEAKRMTISSPLDANKSSHLCFALTGLDCGYDNPIFAALEIDYADVDKDSTGEAAVQAQKVLTYYELDLGLNHVLRKSAEEIDNGANLLFAVPGGGDGPGGVLVACENLLVYRDARNDVDAELRVALPRRADLPEDRGVLIVTGTAHKMKSDAFFLLQSEYGDVYKASLVLGDDGNRVVDLRVSYFDTIATASSIAVLKMGFLFAASEAGNHGFYNFVDLGDHADDAAATARTAQVAEDGSLVPVLFTPRPLRNLELVDDIESLAPLTGLVPSGSSAAAAAASSAPTSGLDQAAAATHGVVVPGQSVGVSSHLYALCGQSARATLRQLRPGIAVNEITKQKLPGSPTGVWSLKRQIGDEHDGLLVVSFTNATLVLGIGETIEEVKDSGFDLGVATLAVQLLDDNSLVQVHANALRVIRPDKRANEWAAPRRRAIQKVTCNARQVALAVAGGEVYYFELDMTTSQLLAVEEAKLNLGSDVASLALPTVPEGRQRAKFLAVGTFDAKVSIYSLEPDALMEKVAVMGVHRPAEALHFMSSASTSSSTSSGTPDFSSSSSTSSMMGLHLHAATEDGIFIRAGVDVSTGALSDQRQRFLGPTKPRLLGATVKGQPAMLALSTTPWLGYSDMGRYTLAALATERLDHAASFSSEAIPEGIVGVAGDELRFLTTARLGESFAQLPVPLRYTPRRFVTHAGTGALIVAESDHQVVPLPEGATGGGGPEQDEVAQAERAQFGVTRGAPGQWASCLRVLNPSTLAVWAVLELPGSPCITSMAWVTFAGPGGGGGAVQTQDLLLQGGSAVHTSGSGTQPTLLVVGTAEQLQFSPRACAGGHLHCYRVVPGASVGTIAGLELLHSTPTEDVPGALCEFGGRLACGVGKALRLYDVGKKRLLKKCEHRGIPTMVKDIQVVADRLWVSDTQESVHLVKYRSEDNAFTIVADDSLPRYVTATCVLDYDSVAVGDKFGNVAVLRLPAETSRRIDADPSGGKAMEGTAWLNAAPNKLDVVSCIHVGDVVTDLRRAVLQPGGTESLVYGTVSGGIGALTPFAGREEADFFQYLEMHMRTHLSPLCGRDHLAYRSYHFVVKECVDGDLIEQFGLLSGEVQAKIASDLEEQGVRTAADVVKRIEDLRARVM